MIYGIKKEAWGLLIVSYLRLSTAFGTIQTTTHAPFNR